MASEQDTGPVFFWKPEEKDGYLGQWYTSTFIVKEDDESDGASVSYKNCEHYMMHQKALLFAPNDAITQTILAPKGNVPDPRTLKQLGRKIPNFDEATWVQERTKIVEQGNYYKFKQNPKLKAKLLATGDRELVEASPRDRIWGIGYGAKNAPNMRKTWGLNLLGKALMEVRERIREEEEEDDW
ncbi:hypothetical protein FQN57_006702 [Myotisia sp. PD_48]|nr:hypothetical protein FQN57_006702 [Myotisia sp. PD_48]